MDFLADSFLLNWNVFGCHILRWGKWTCLKEFLSFDLKRSRMSWSWMEVTLSLFHALVPSLTRYALLFISYQTLFNYALAWIVIVFFPFSLFDCNRNAMSKIKISGSSLMVSILARRGQYLKSRWWTNRSIHISFGHSFSWIIYFLVPSLWRPFY